jgi:hypothetical protein
MKNQLIEIKNGILSALEQNDGMLAKVYVNKLDALIQQETLEEFDKPHQNYKDLSSSIENDFKKISKKDKGGAKLKEFYKRLKGDKKLSEEEENLEEFYHNWEALIGIEIKRGYESAFLQKLMNKNRNLSELELSHSIIKAYELKFALIGRRVCLYL